MNLFFKFGKYWKAIKSVQCETCEREFTLYKAYRKYKGEYLPMKYAPRCPDCQSEYSEAKLVTSNSRFKSYYVPDFTCDNCGGYKQDAVLYSPAKNKEQLETKPHYCGQCAKNQSAPSASKPKPMKTKKSKLKPKRVSKNSLKPKTLKPKKALKPTKRTKTTALTLKPRTSTPAYYNCLLNQAKRGFQGKITKACKECKTNAPALNLAYKKEAQKLVGAYKQLGISLSKILSH